MTTDPSRPQVTCTDCGTIIPPTPPGHCGGTGYATYREDGTDKHVCYACCGERDARDMETGDRIVLYLTKDKDGWYKVTNWPGSLSFRAYAVSIGKHNIARTRTDFRFTDRAGNEWRGTQYGDWSDIARCRKLKTKTSRHVAI